MLVSSYRQIWVKTLLSLAAIALLWTLGGCRDRIETNLPPETPPSGSSAVKLAEVAPPPVVQELRSQLETYQPQVAIIEPQSDRVLSNTTARVKLQVQDLPIFKNAQLGLGPHLHLILDNQPYRAVYTTDEPIVFENLQPGTHTLRVFASRPWHESFKNEGAYAQTTFHVIAPSNSNAPETTKPLLTYSRPKGSYGAEPILLDFYLTNAPLHLVAAEDPEDNIEDWRIRVTVNGQSFLVDTWQPLYLTGFQTGQNWVKLELLDEEGNPTDNAFNTTVRLIDYEPDGQDTLSKLVRGELAVADAQGIVDPNYIPPVPPEEVPSVEEEPVPPEIIEEPAVEKTQPVEPELTQPPTTEENPAPAEIEPSPEATPPAAEETSPPAVEEEPTVEEAPFPTPIEPSSEVEIPAVEEEPTVEETSPPAVEEMPEVEETSPVTPVQPPVEIVPPPEIESSAEAENPVVEEAPSPTPIETPVEGVPTPTSESSAGAENPVVEEEPTVEETSPPAVEETPVVEETPSPTPIETSVEGVPTPTSKSSAGAENPVVEEEPTVEETSAAEEVETAKQPESRFKKFRNVLKREKK
ncbi:MAG: hypothetical protein SW833_23770 [Cyanobacteriota bacterium]|nr:hypothetical protein [Cyanobacteriota bacterium]